MHWGIIDPTFCVLEDDYEVMTAYRLPHSLCKVAMTGGNSRAQLENED